MLKLTNMYGLHYFAKLMFCYYYYYYYYFTRVSRVILQIYIENVKIDQYVWFTLFCQINVLYILFYARFARNFLCLCVFVAKH